MAGKVLILILLPLFTFGQDSIKKEKVSLLFTLGLGKGTGIPPGYYDDNKGMSGTLQIALQKQKNIYSFSIRSVEKFSLLGEPSSGAMESFEITYGRTFSSRSFFLNANTGVGWVTEHTKGEIIESSFFTKYSRIKRHTAGVPLSVKAFWKASEYISFGPEVYINLN